MDKTKCILIVDDEANVRLMLRTTLESVGYAVKEAEDGHRALELLNSPDAACDLVVLDLLMPKMDGMELLRQLRAHAIGVPVAILTAHGSIQEAVEAMLLLGDFEKGDQLGGGGELDPLAQPAQG